MKIYLHPLEKGRKKSDLEGEVAKETGKELSGEEYVRRIREAVSEGKEYLRKGNSDKAAEKFDTAYRLYNFLNVLGSEQGLRSMLQEGAGAAGRGAGWKENLEGKIEKGRHAKKRYEDRTSQHIEPGYIPPDMSDEEKERYRTREKELLEKGKPLVSLYVKKPFFANKWFFWLPWAKMAKENWRVQGRPGWEIPGKGLLKILKRFEMTRFFGQPPEYVEDRPSERFTHYVYIKDHREDNPKKRLIYKISKRKMGKDREQGKPYYMELWKYTQRRDQTRPTWNVINRACENFASEDTESDSIFSISYSKGKDGLAVFETEEHGEKFGIMEDAKGMGEAWHNAGRLYRFDVSLSRLPIDRCAIDKDLFMSIIRGRQYSVTNHIFLRGKERYAKIKKNRWLSLARSIIPFLVTRFPPFKKKFKLGEWKFENYKVDLYDKAFAGSAIKEERESRVMNVKLGTLESDYLGGTLASIIPFYEREREYHKFRFKYRDEPGPYHSSVLRVIKPYDIFQSRPV